MVAIGNQIAQMSLGDIKSDRCLSSPHHNIRCVGGPINIE